MAFRQQEIETENFTPRPYQLELLEKAKKENLIIPLGTGTGKTFIAVMLIRELAAETRVPFENGGKRSFFLVDKVPLVKQQADQIRTHTDLKVSEYHGANNTDLWTSDRWEQEFKENNVLVMTAQIFLDMLNHGFFLMERANVIVFDECHHATRNHPYHEIMRQYSECKNSKPRILGLTASIINESTTPNRLERLMLELESALSSRIETTSDMTCPSKYGAKPKIVTLKCRNFDGVLQKFAPVRQLLVKTLEFCKVANFNEEFEIDPRKPIVKALTRTLAIFDQLGPWCTWRVCTIIERQLVKLDKYSMTEMEQLFILMGQTTIRMAKQMLEPYVSDVDSLEKALKWLPSRVHRLLECLRSLNPRKRENSTAAKSSNPVTHKEGKKNDQNEFSGIIFVEQRYVAKTLRDCLKYLQNYAKDEFGYLRIDFVVGYSGYNVAEEDERSLHRRQEEVLKNFRQKNLNLLVSTSVLEEGVDVRQCNCVIRFDTPKNFRSFIQSKGRARKKDSLYIVLVDEKDADVWSVQYKNFAVIERILLNHCHSRQVPPKEDIDMQHADQVLPPYFPPIKENEPTEGRPRVTMTTAIPLINRYCAKLPSDVFTRLAPKYDVIKTAKSGVIYYQGSLILPINSPVKDIITGPLMLKQKYAQMATALEACKVLHQRNELDRHLLPVGKESVLKFLIEDDEEWPADGRVRPGSTKRKQYYSKKTADAFLDARPINDCPSYVHVIDLGLAVPLAGEHGAKNYQLSFDPSSYPRFWGILSKKPMPKIPGFSVYSRQGKLNVQITSLPYTIQLDESQLGLVSKFHEYIFSEILHLSKYSMAYDPVSATNTIYIVPLRKGDPDGFLLDFPFVKSITDIEKLPRKPTDEEQKQFHFVKERYLDAVIMPWYRNVDRPACFYVSQICAHLTPKSPFPDVDFSSFNDYFFEKYGLDIYNQDQPMLDGDHVDSRLNLTLPRYVNHRRQQVQATSTKEGNTKPESILAAMQQHQLFVPELVDIHPIPASLWSMIVCLPTILYRINSLLVADEWRIRVEQQLFGRTSEIPTHFSWEPLSYSSRKKGSSKQEPDVFENGSTANPNRQSDAAGKTADGGDGFEIGVWDPNLAANIVLDPPSAAVQPPNGLIADQRVTSLINGQDAGTNANDDDDWDDDEIYFDIEMSQRFMNLQRRSAGGGINGGQKYDDPFAPRNSIEPTGWDATTSGNFKAESNSSNGSVLSFLSSDGQFNATALLNDIVNFGGVAMAPVPAPSRTNIQFPTIQPLIGASSEQEADTLIDDVWGGKVNEKKSRKVRTNVAASDFDDVDEREKIETIDLIDLGITDDEVGPSTMLKVKSPTMRIYGCDSPIDMNKLSDSRRSSISGEGESRQSPELQDDAGDVSKQQATDDIFGSISAMAMVPLTSGSAEISFEVDDFDVNVYGPNPCLILQALTMSNANDGINLERLETVGDSFLKFAVTSCLFNVYPDFHEGKLSFLRSKHVSNYNLYKLGKRKGLGQIMIACKFEPNDNWLPPGFCPLEQDAENVGADEDDSRMECVLEAPIGETTTDSTLDEKEEIDLRQPKAAWPLPEDFAGHIPYNLLTQHSIPDKSIADAVEAMIGVYLLTYGPKRTIQFLQWLGLKPAPEPDVWNIQPRQPLLNFEKDPMAQLQLLWQRFNLSAFEHEIGYTFKNKAYLIQAFTHASYYYNRVTDCYQRLEFLGDAVLDYMITRHLFEDKRQHSPGVLTDLRSALVNNTIFASLAVKYKFHKYFMALCPGMSKLMTNFVAMIEQRQEESNFDEEFYLLNEEDCEDEEDIEVPKALGDMFESVAGAIFLDSGGSLDAVWRVYYRMMKEQIEKCCANPPKSPIRELLELEPEKAKFSKLERDVVEGKIRVTVDVYGKGRFVGMGRNYRIAKCTAAKRALKYLKMLQMQEAAGK